MTNLPYRLSFKLAKAEDCSVDDEWQVYLDGKKTGFAIQITMGLYSVTKAEYDNPEDESTLNGVIFYEGVFRSLADAKRSLVAIMEKEEN